MKKLNIYLLSVFILLLTACSSNEDSSTETVSESEVGGSELAELEEENSNNGPEEGETTEDQGERDNQHYNSESDRSKLVFDITSPEVISQFIGTENKNKDGYFEQDAITVGVSQTEIEEKYGAYDFTLQAGGSAPAFYGNLAVIYSGFYPYGDGDDASDSSINPDENYVEAVYYYAGITENELIEAWGEPQDARTTGPALIYQGEGDDGNYYVTLAGSSITRDGELISIIQRNIYEENPNEPSQSAVNEDDLPTTDDSALNAEIKDEADYEFLLTEYLNRLTAHYNMNEYDDVYYYLRKGSPAYDKIADYKASGHLTGHETYEVELVSMTDLGDGTVMLNANRVYSHDNSNGQRITNVDYIMNAETHEIIDFEVLLDEEY